MSRRTILTLSTAASLYGLYAVYALFVSPHFSPQLTELPEQNNLPHELSMARSSKSQEEAARWLSQHAWVRKAKWEIRPDKLSCVYTQDLKELPSGEILFKPFAMISHRADDPEGREPITIVSEAAQLKFENGSAISSLQAGPVAPEGKSSPGRIIGARMDGEVQLHGADGLSLIGRDFIFAESAQRMWSDKPVAFTYRRSHGTGRGLELDLLPSPKKAEKGDGPNIGGVKTLRLLTDVVMNMIQEPKGVSTFDSSRSTVAGFDKETRTITVTSKGRFEYVVDANVATYHNDVRVRSPTGPNEFDTISDVDVLTVIFERSAAKKNPPPLANVSATSSAFGGLPTPDPKVAATAKSSAGGKEAGGDLEFQRLMAEGHPVLITSQRSQLIVRAEQLVYEATSRVVSLQDSKRQVQVRQRSNELFSPKITLQLAEGGKVLSAVCRGRGSLKSYPPDAPAEDISGSRGRRELQFFAEWSQQMRKYPDPDSTLDLIELHGEAVLNQPEKMALKADLVKIWITPEEANGGSSSRKSGKQNSQAGPKPKRLLAIDKVAFATPQMRGETKQLKVWFEEGELQPAPDAPVLDEARRTPRLPPLIEDGSAELPPVYNPQSSRRSVTRRKPSAPPSENMKGFAAVDDATPSQSPSRRDRHRNRGEGTGGRRRQEPKSPPATAPTAQPMHIVADVISVRTVGAKSEVSEVVTERKVEITQQREKGTPPLIVRGDRLHLWNYLGNSQVVRVTGLPAEVRDRGLQLEGAVIRLDRARNLLRVDGAGMLRMPLQASPDGRKLDQPQFLEVWWKEKMNFNGLVANFYRNVKSIFGENRVNCQEMEVTLTRRISFSETNPGQSDREGGSKEPQAQVDIVHCHGEVDVDNHEFVGNRLTEIRKANTFELTMSQRTGDISASGPGTLQIWRRRSGNRSSGLPGLRTGQPKRPATAEPSDETPAFPWEYTKVNFAGTMKGNGKDRTTTFHERVEVVDGPVESSHATVDGDDLPADGGWMKCDSLQLTQRVPPNPQARGSLEMLASGNAEMGGREFHGLADMISYDEAKGAFLLRSVGTRKATIWRQVRPGAEHSRAEAQRMQFIPSTKSLTTSGTAGVDGLLGP